jgi:D-methionine transport system substrate-binding protein
LLPETLTGLLAAITVTAIARDALFIEGADSPYANLVAARPDNVNSPAILKLVAALRSPEAKKFVQDTYHGAVLTTF